MTKQVPYAKPNSTTRPCAKSESAMLSPVPAEVPTFDDLLAQPERVKELPPAIALDILTRVVALTPLLVSRAAVPPDPPIEHRCLTADDVAERLHVPTQFVYDLVRRKMLPAVHVGKYVRVPLAAFERWLKNALDTEISLMYSVNHGRRRAAPHSKTAAPDAGANGRAARLAPE
jgi:excisionase family DNA binding protein